MPIDRISPDLKNVVTGVEVQRRLLGMLEQLMRSILLLNSTAVVEYYTFSPDPFLGLLPMLSCGAASNGDDEGDVNYSDVLMKTTWRLPIPLNFPQLHDVIPTSFRLNFLSGLLRPYLDEVGGTAICTTVNWASNK